MWGRGGSDTLPLATTSETTSKDHEEGGNFGKVAMARRQKMCSGACPVWDSPTGPLTGRGA